MLWSVRNLLLLLSVVALMTACGSESTPSEAWSEATQAPAEEPMFSIQPVPTPQPVYPQPAADCVTAMLDLAGTPRACSPTMGALEVAQ